MKYIFVLSLIVVCFNTFSQGNSKKELVDIIVNDSLFKEELPQKYEIKQAYLKNDTLLILVSHGGCNKNLDYQIITKRKREFTISSNKKEIISLKLIVPFNGDCEMLTVKKLYVPINKFDLTKSKINLFQFGLVTNNK